MNKHVNVLLGKLCPNLKWWKAIPRTKRLLMTFGLSIIISGITYLTLVVTINWQARLMQAVIDGNIKKARIALFFKANPSKMYSYAGQTLSAVDHAIRNKQPKMLSFLVNRGGSIDYHVYDDYQNWYHAVTEVIQIDDPQTIETYVSLGGKLDDCTYQHHNALTFAIVRRKTNAIKTLVKHIDINQQDNAGLLPITYAFKVKDSIERNLMLNRLISLGADIDCQAKDGSTSLHQYINLVDIVDGYEMLSDITSFIKKHSKKGIDVPNHSHMTPLMLAAYEGNIKAMKGLIRSGSNLNFTNKYGKGVFDVLYERKHDALFTLYATKLKTKNPKAFKRLQKRFPQKITPKGIIKKPPKPIAKHRKRYRSKHRRSGIGRKLLRRLGPVGFFLSFL